MSGSRSIAEQIRRALVARDEARVRGQDLRSYLVASTGSEADAESILSTLSGIERNHAAIEASGEGRAVFLAEKLEEARARLAPGETIEIIGADAASESSTLARVVTDALVVSTTEGLDSPSDEVVVEIESAKSFMERDLGHAEDADVTASIVAELLPGARSRLTSIGPFVAETVTAAVDLGLQSSKAAYHVGTGRIGVSEGLGWVLDRAAAGAGTLVEKVTPRLAEVGGAMLGTVLGAFVGLGQEGGRVGRELGRMAGEAIAKPLGNAVKELGRAISPALKSGFEAVVSWGRRVVGWLV